MMNSIKGGHSCVVRSCKSRSVDKNIRFFRLPKERSRAMAWLQASNRMDLKEKSSIDLYKNYRICALHFKKCMYTSPENNRLLPTATPTEFDNAKSYYCKRPHSPSPENVAKNLKPSSDINGSTQFTATSDHTYHKALNTRVQQEVNQLTSSLIESEPTTPKPVRSVNSGPTILKSGISSKLKPSILKSVLTAPNKPIEMIDLTTSQDHEPITKSQPEMKVMKAQKSYLLIPKEFVQFIPGTKEHKFVLPPILPVSKEFVQFIPGTKEHKFVLPPILPAPQHFLKYTSEKPKKIGDSSSSIPEIPPEPPNSTACMPDASRQISSLPEKSKLNSTSSLPEVPQTTVLNSTSALPEPPQMTVLNSTSALPAPNIPATYTLEPSKQFSKSTSCELAPTSSVTSSQDRTKKPQASNLFMKHVPEPPKQPSASTSTPLASASSVAGLQQKTIKTHASNLFMRYAPEPPKQPAISTSSPTVPTYSITGLQEKPKQAFHVQTQTSAGITASLPRIVKQTKTIRALYRKNARLQKLLNNKSAPKPTLELFSKYCDTFLTPPMAEFVRTQAQLCRVSEHGRRYNDEYKEFAEKMYSLGPRCYKYLQKLFCLPSIKSLQRDKSKTVPDQENEKLSQQPPVESLHHLTKEIKCLPSFNNEELQQTRSCLNKAIIQQIQYFPVLNNEQIGPIQISFQPILQQPENTIHINENIQPVVIEPVNHFSGNEQLEQAIKSLEPMTSLPDLSEL